MPEDLPWSDLLDSAPFKQKCECCEEPLPDDDECVPEGHSYAGNEPERRRAFRTRKDNIWRFYTGLASRDS